MGGGSKKKTSTSATTTSTNTDARRIYDSGNVAGRNNLSVGGYANRVTLTNANAFELADTVVRQQGEFLEDASLFLGETLSDVLNVASGRDDINFDAAGDINSVQFDPKLTAESIPYIAAALAVGAVGYGLVRSKK